MDEIFSSERLVLVRKSLGINKAEAAKMLNLMMILVYLVQASCNTRTPVPLLSGQWFC